MPLRIGVLGPLAAWDGGRELDVGTGRQRAVLALLTLHANKPVSSDRLLDALWNGEPPATAQKVLQGYVSQLRRVLPPDAIVTRGSTYELRVDDTDAKEAARLVDRASGEPREQAAASLRDALARFRGEPYAEFAYESWAQPEVRRLEELRLTALEARFDAELGAGADAALVPELEALVAEHPLRERLHVQLMHALYLSGRQADALDVFQALRRRLVELGLEPGPDLRDVQRRILAHDPELGRARRPPARAAVHRGRTLIGLGTALLVAAAAVAVIVIVRGGSSSALAANALAFVDLHNARAHTEIAFTSPQSSIAVGDGVIWALNGDTGTITSIDERTRHTLATFSAGQRPIDVTYGDGSFWVLDGGFQPAPGEHGKPIAPAVTRYDPQTHTPTGSVAVPDADPGVGFFYFHHQPGQHMLAYGDGSLWFATAASLGASVYRVDPASDHIVAHVAAADAGSIVFADGALWTENQDAFPTVQLERVNPATNRVDRKITVPVIGSSTFAVGGGALWIPDFYTGTVWRVLPGPPTVLRPVVAAPGGTSIVYANGAIWLGNEADDTVTKIDVADGAIVKTLRVPAPQALVGVQKALLVATGAKPGATLPATSCGALHYDGSGSPRLLIAADLDFRGVPEANLEMAAAVLKVLRASGFRAGRYTVGYQACDDSSGISGVFDPGKCIANASIYAKTPKLIGVVGTYDSGCAGEEVPILESARSGPVAIVSPTNTYDFLTRRTPGLPPDMLDHLYPRGIRNYARVIAPDASEVAAGAQFLHDLGVRRVAMLDDGGQGATPSHEAWFEYSAARLGMHVDVVRARTVRALVDRLRALHAQALFVAKDMPYDPRLAYSTLRHAFGSSWPIVGTDFLGANPFNTGTYLLAAGLPNAQLPPAVRRLHDSISLGGAYAAGAAEVLLDAIARSNGTRASVVDQLLRTHLKSTYLGDLRFTAGGDPVGAPVSVFRASPIQGTDPYFQHEQFVRAIVPPQRIIHP
jgi:DNA-binding SARP family transcriptional activator